MDQALLAQLEGLQRRDVETRTRLLERGRLYGVYDEEMQRVHIENAEALRDLVAAHGWPGVSKVGIEGSRAAWLVAQHAICTPGLQREFLRQLTAAAEAGDAPMKQVALLSDRIRFNEGRPQRYGTVLDWNEAGELDCELEDPDHVDGRRAAVGLPPFAESLREHREEVAAEGGTPPGDFQAYQRAAHQWAECVGWR